MIYSYKIKKHIERFYDGVCTVTTYQNQRGIINNTTEKITQENIACRLSYKTIKNTEQTDIGANVTQVVKLFLPPDVQVKEGSKVTVTQEGMTASFICSGKPAVYGNFFHALHGKSVHPFHIRVFPAFPLEIAMSKHS